MAVKLASQKQTDFIKRLLEERVLDSTIEGFVANRRELAIAGKLESHHASDMIAVLLQQPKKEAIKPDAPKYAQLEDGMYVEVNGTRIFKVIHAVHGSGNQYAKELLDGRFEYVPGAIQFVRQECRRMTLDDAKEYGAVYGMCCVCTRTLTNEDSIEAGIGPVCSGRL